MYPKKSTLSITALAKGEVLVSARASWVKPNAAELFSHPWIMVFAKRLSPDTGAVEMLTCSTAAHEDVSDALIEMYQRFVHPSLRSFMERGIIEQWHGIIESDAYKKALDAYRRHKGYRSN